jgi:hypothetical protein
MNRVHASGALLLFASITTACAGVEDDVDTSSEALVETNKVQIRLAAFIPCEGIDGFGIYDGDGRSFGHDAAAQSSRVLLDATIDPAGFDPVTARVFPSKKFSSSAVERKNGWCVDLRAGAVPERTATADASRVFATISERPDWQGHAVTRVRLEAHARNPLLWFSPNLDAVMELDIYYTRTGGTKKPRWVTFSGSHDAFPSWELYVDRVPVIQHDALRDSNGPIDLLPGNERSHSGLCTRQAPSATTGAVWTCEEDR